jgi:hypothetical protein
MTSPSKGDMIMVDNEERVLAPGDPVTDVWMTRPGCRRVLAPIPHLQAASRILDVLPLLETDLRVQIVLTTPRTGYQWDGMGEFARDLGRLWMPWQQAIQIRWDLVLAACDWGVSELHGPVVLLPHGVGAFPSRIGPWQDAR